ncbi:MAG TPA: alpha/beta fold hydrolase [Candidatus Baltobacteraceae bacterium]|jgi:carboxylesterase|nr:alpha/beta fold hydrolase [Candidatus Baltobacteraceae bacterium]
MTRRSSDSVYEDAQERLERFARRDHEGISELGRTLVFDHGHRTERATLLFHGLSASPRQFIEVAQSLHARGHNVFVPRLPRHGYNDRLSDALAQMNVRQLKACAEESLRIVRGLGERVCVSGFSLGGLLAAYLGQVHHVYRIVAIVPFMGVAFVPSAFRLRLANWVLARPNRFLWWDPIARERQLPAHGYPRYASHAIAHGLALAHEVLDDAYRHAPKAEELVVAINVREPAVSNSAIMALVNHWNAHTGGAVRVHRFTDLPIAHDIIEPKRYPDVAQRVAPVIVELIDA